MLTVMRRFWSTSSSQTLQVQSLVVLDITEQDKGIVKESRDGVKCFTELIAFSCDTLGFLSTVPFFSPNIVSVTSIGILTM